MRLLPSVWRVVAAWLVAALMLPAAGHAEEQPAILKAYGLDWIERVREEAWPQPKAERPVICLLDTGVDITPDTPADDPEGPIVARLALDGGTGVSQGTGYPYDHGTQMAAIIAAPRNGWGTVGVFPQGRIVSIRVTEGTEGYITPEAVRSGVRTCGQWTHAHGVRAAAVAVPESYYQQRTEDVPIWEFARDFAELVNAVMVAAVGNDESAARVAPEAVGGIVSVAAGDESGSPCSFVATQDQSAAWRGPGCALSRSWPQGSSAATVAVAALVGAMATRNPAVTASELRNQLKAQTEPVGSGAVLRAQHLADGFPLAPLSQSQAAVVPGVGVAPTDPTDGSPAARLWRPRVAMAWKRGALRLSRLDHRAKGRLAASCDTRTGTITRRAADTSRRVSFAFESRPRRCQVWIESATEGQWRSLAVRSRVS